MGRGRCSSWYHAATHTPSSATTAYIRQINSQPGEEKKKIINKRKNSQQKKEEKGARRKREKRRKGGDSQRTSRHHADPWPPLTAPATSATPLSPPSPPPEPPVKGITREAPPHPGRKRTTIPIISSPSSPPSSRRQFPTRHRRSRCTVAGAPPSSDSRKLHLRSSRRATLR